jgi:hypothetical protein
MAQKIVVTPDSTWELESRRLLVSDPVVLAQLEDQFRLFHSKVCSAAARDVFLNARQEMQLGSVKVLFIASSKKQSFVERLKTFF